MRLSTRSFGIAAPLVCAAVLLTASSARAATAYVNVGSFGGSGSGAGEFTSPNGIAVDSSTGDIFVADTGNNRVEVFTPTATGATFLTQFGDATTTNTPVGVAVDSSTGDVYVSCAGTTNAIVKFDPDNASDPTAYTQDPSFVSPAQGSGAGQIGSFGEPSTLLIRAAAAGGIAVDPTVDPTTGTHDILVADPVDKLIDRFTSNGTFVSAFNGSSSGQAFTEPADVAVDSAGDVIVADITSSTDGRILKFAPDGSSATTLAGVPNPSPGTRGIVVSADPATGEAFASSLQASVSSPGAIYRFDAAGALEQAFGTTTPTDLSYIFGLAASGTNPGRLYAVASNDSGLLTSPGAPMVQVFQAVTPPTVTLDPVAAANVTTTGASFSGTVNPQGSQVSSCEFQYVAQSDTGGFADASSVPCVANPGAGSSAVPVTATAAGLLPNTAYVVRLVAASNGGAASSTSTEQTFTTVAAPPVVVEAHAIAGSTDATLAGEVNPRGSDTSCHFEWGTGTSYGQTATCASGPGEGQAPAYVYAAVGGLTPGTTYHFRLVAQSSAGTATGSDQTITPGALSARAYELVSPLPTGGVDTNAALGSAASSDGDRVLFESNLYPYPGYGLHYYYVATRGTQGWSSQGVDPSPQGPTWAGTSAVEAPDDVSRVLVRTTARLDSDDQNADPNDTTENGASLPNGTDLYLGPLGGPLTWISRDPRIPLGTPQTASAPVFDAGRANSMSADGSTVVLSSERQLSDQDTTPGNTSRLYKWEDGQLSFIGVLPDGSVPTGGSSLDIVSSDGSRVVFNAADDQARGNSELFEQIDGQPATVDLSNPSPSECTTCSPTTALATFAGASSDAQQVFFTTTQQLVNADTDSTTDLYEYDFDQPAGHNIIQVSAGGAGDPTPGSGANVVQGQGGTEGLAISDDGSHVYFVATGALTTDPNPLGQTATAGADNIYLYERNAAHPSGQTTFIATVDAADATDAMQTSPDGSVLAFTSTSSITGQPTRGAQQVYVYDQADASLVCASCSADGSAPAGAASMSKVGFLALAPQRWVSSDGSVFFDTPTQLVPGDTNSAVDVYEYNVDGELRLISAGTGTSDSTFVSASTDGSTVFFQTRDALVPQDDEPGVQKIYAARVGGGFSSQPSGPPACSGDDCRNALSGAPAPPAAASVAFVGPPNGTTSTTTKAKVRVTGKAVKGEAFTLTVKTPAKGKIRISGAKLKNLTRSVDRAGSYKLTVHLSAKEQRTLQRELTAKQKALAKRTRKGKRPPKAEVTAKVAVKVVYKPASGKASTATVTVDVEAEA